MLFPGRAKTRVIHRQSGYRGYMDQKPIRKPNWHMIAVIVGGLFCCGALSSAIGILTLPGLFGGADPLPTEMIAVQLEPTETTSALIANVSTAQPTHTPTATATPTNTPTATRTLEPTQDALQMTVDAVSTNLAEIRAMTHVPTFTPEPDDISTTTPAPEPSPRREYSRVAIVQFDNVVVRSGPSADYQAVTMAWYGERFGVIDERTTDSAQYSRWIRIDHPMHSSAWIAAHLVRIDDE